MQVIKLTVCDDSQKQEVTGTLLTHQREPVAEKNIVYFYRPQRSCGKVMFLHLSVILFTGGSLSGRPWTETL